MKIANCVLFLLLNASASSYAADVSVRYEEETYYLSADFDVDATPARVMEVLTDFENIADLNPAIIISELQDAPQSNNLRVRTVVKDCILFFCKKITRVEDVVQYGNEKLEAFLIPMLSDLRSGYAVWVLTQNPYGTTVKYDADMQPKFWIPPIIRSYVLTRKFKKRVNEAVERLQTVAKSK